MARRHEGASEMPGGSFPQSDTRPPPVENAIGVLISGRGSNLQALVAAAAEGRLGAPIRVVISNRDDAAGIERARAAGIETLVVPHRGQSREDYDRRLV